ncbi:sialidase family protein [Arcanobacterium phocae]|uniref:sialidase family protein n=1 Tax=Arcanobacterium phocae TaxID=131112 RepID=UPI001C0F0BB4|nr:sialidase family protein [Arcanobacterium phocae]
MRQRRVQNSVVAGFAATALTLSGLVAGTLAYADQQEPSETNAQLVAQPSVKMGDGEMTQVHPIKERDEGKAWFRIPAITATPGGDLIVAFDERPLSAGDKGIKAGGFNGQNWLSEMKIKWKNGEDSPNPNSIQQYRSKDNGKTWQKDGYICSGNPVSDWKKIEGCSDPSYVVDWETGAIFNFHVRSYEAGIQESVPGNDHNNRNVIHVEVSQSTDDGKTWTSKIITKDVTPDEQVKWRFAASGQGIQLTHPKHKGWLVQQFTQVKNGSSDQEAFSLISEDHGETWKPGSPVGTEMDENKVVELSNGDLLLTSRNQKGPSNNMADGHGYRWQAISHDGGMSWGSTTQMPDINEGKTNGQIVRAFPHFTGNDPRAKVLVYGNAQKITDHNSKGQNNDRSKGTVWLSCDDGKSWKQNRVFNEGSTGYVTLTVQHDGRIGMLSEDGSKEGYKDYGIYYRSFGLDWVGSCPGVAEAMELEQAKQQLADAEEKLADATEKIQVAEKQVAELTKKLADVEDENTAVEAELKEAEAAKKTAESNLEKAEAEKKAAEAKLAQAEAAKQETEKKLTDAETSNLKLANDLESTEKKLSEESESYQAEIALLKEENAKLKAELEKVKKELEEDKEKPQVSIPLVPLTPAQPREPMPVPAPKTSVTCEPGMAEESKAQSTPAKTLANTGVALGTIGGLSILSLLGGAVVVRRRQN